MKAAVALALALALGLTGQAGQAPRVAPAATRTAR